MKCPCMLVNLLQLHSLHIGLGKKNWESRTEPKETKLEPKESESRYSVPCSVPVSQKPNYVVYFGLVLG
jgi:hypothetical protein